MNVSSTNISDDVTEALHEVHTAINDVLKGYGEMLKRAEPEIQPLIGRLTHMHQQHAAALQAELRKMRESTDDDSSIQGTLNKAVVVMRDWMSDLDRDVLPRVREGEEALRDEYTDALSNPEVRECLPVATLLKTQHEAIVGEIARLPKD